MEVLLSCVNSLVSFIGYDLTAKASFWYCPADRVRACGAAFEPHFAQDRGALLVASDSSLSRYSAAKGVERIALPGPHDNLAHSVHLDNGRIGVVDTGNSRLLLYGSDLDAAVSVCPLEGWEGIPADAIHLNDFVRTPKGLVGSCFNYRPYRSVEFSGRAWQKMGYGLLLSLEKEQGRFVGRVLAGGLNCPHSLVWHGNSLFCCSSATGEFLRFAYNDSGTLVEQQRTFISDDYFIRGALPLEDGSWLLGGSSKRKEHSKGMALLHLRKDGAITVLPVAAAGEIYDILPWNASIMTGVTDIMAALPPAFGENENVYPPPCVLPKERRKLSL